MSVTTWLWRGLGGAGLILALFLIAGVGLADDPKGKGKDKPKSEPDKKGNVITVDLDKLPPGLAKQLRERGWNPIGVDLSELLKAGGSVKCCTLEIRA